MRTDNDILELIKLVNMSYKHISQLETLIDLIDSKVMAGDKVSVIAKTTRNSKYRYQFYRSPKLQDPENHINNYVDDDLKIIKSL